MSEVREDLEQRAQRAILQHALMRWETAGFLAAGFLTTFLLSLFDANLLSIPNVSWFVLGLVAYLTLAYSSFTDEEGNRKVVEQLLRHEFAPKRIRKPDLKTKIEEALDYRSRITDMINERSDDSTLKIQLLTMADQFDEWIEEIYDLAKRLDEYELEKPRLSKSFERATQRRSDLKKKLKRTRDARVKEEIESSVTTLDKQIATIQSLQNTMKRAELRLDNTVALMGTIYPQTMLLSAKDIDSGRFRRLQQEIVDEVDELADVLWAMDEVYGESEI